ncbi:MAG: hypothetical protein ABFD58_11345 [Anaerolineaceae bacterium]
MKQTVSSYDSTTIKPRIEKKQFVFHPLFFGFFPFLSLFANNFSQVVPVLTLRAFFLTAIIIILSYWLIRKIFHDRYRAALILSSCFFFFFTYGHLYDLLEGKMLLGFLMGRHLVLAPLWLVLWMIVLWLIVKRTKNLEQPTIILNAISVLLVSIALFQIGWKIIRAPQSQLEEPATIEQFQVSSEMPDVYYIILDSYSRQDALLKYHHLNTSSFVSKLEEIGFVFPACTQSN